MKLLTPLDQSTRDGIVLRYCRRMATDLGASIVLANVVSLTRALRPRGMREAQAYVDAVEAGLREDGLEVEAVVQRGDPAPIVIAIADQFEVDLIVMATRARGSFGKMVLGSVADAVLMSCQRPVLLLSESSENEKPDENTRLQSAYLAATVWHRQVKGVYTPQDAERELGRLAAAGLDRSVLVETYQAQQKGGPPVPWLDIDFQIATLETFLPEALPEQEAPPLPVFSAERAA